jgi:DNA-binding NtrC family response regulator
MIHEQSPRSTHKFVALNCGTIPGELVRSELFGHLRGAFTGANSDHHGLFRQAHKGTLFLDELGELPFEQQPHLLRALDSGLIRRIGSPVEELVDTRIVAATNRLCLNPQTSPLREDLFQRLSAIVIQLPPLRERKVDIPLLVNHYLEQNQDEYGPRKVEPATLDALKEHAWMGNVRELQNSVQRAIALGPTTLRLHDFLPGGIARPPSEGELFLMQERRLTPWQKNQRNLVAEAYERHRSIRAAARSLGIPKSTFADMCKRLGVNTSRRRKVLET